MRGIPQFNYPMFNTAARQFREVGWDVFNPAERDLEVHGVDISEGNILGSIEQASADHGFCLRRALGDDTAYICSDADAILMLPGWAKSKGAVAEHALADALGLTIYYYEGRGIPHKEAVDMPAVGSWQASGM